MFPQIKNPNQANFCPLDLLSILPSKVNPRNFFHDYDLVFIYQELLQENLQFV